MAVTAAERNQRYAQYVDLYVIECGHEGCGIVFAMPDDYDDRRRRDGKTFYCPNGHGRAYLETEEKRLRKRLDAAERRASQAEETARSQRERAAKAERSAIAYRGHLTRMKNRIANGVCPVPGCKRTGLIQTMRHIATKHPRWAAEHAHELA